MKIRIISNPKKAWAHEVAKEAKTLLKKHGHTIVGKGIDGKRMNAKGADATICIGGDGTILYAGHRNKLEGAILGIGSGTSYICQLRAKNWKEYIVNLIENGKTTMIMSLDVQVGKQKYRAINDCVIHSTNYRVIGIRIIIGKKEGAFEGDGLIIASPLGSQAYAYSAGGTALDPKELGFSIAPICPYRRRFSPSVESPESEIMTMAGARSAVILDGILVGFAKKDERIVVKKGTGLIFYEGIGRYD